jgi:hypothetical protein
MRLCPQVAIRNNQQGVLYFAANVKPGVLAQQPPPAAASSLDDLFVSPLRAL